MSGGSWDYLYCKGARELLDSIDTLKDMADRLTELNCPTEAGKTLAIRSLVELVRDQLWSLDKSIDSIRDVWKAVEWLDSRDIDQDEFKERIEENRKE